MILFFIFFEIVRGVKRDQMNKVLGIGKQRTILTRLCVAIIPSGWIPIHVYTFWYAVNLKNYTEAE